MPLSCEIAKRWFLGPRFAGEGIPQISDMRFQITLTSDHVAEYGLGPSSVRGAPRLEGEKKKEERKKNPW